MNSLLKNAIKYLLMLALGGFLFWYVLKDLDAAKVESDFRKADYFWIGVSVLISLIAYWARAVRWNLLLEPLDIKPPTYKTFIALMSGYFANTFVPRGGEVARCLMLNRMHKAPFNATFGSVVAERVFDMIGLLVLIGVTVILEFERVSNFISDIFTEKFQGIFGSLQSMYLFVLVAVALLAGLIGTLWMLRHRIRQHTVYQKTSVFLGGIWAGVIGIRKLEKKWMFLFYTIVIWVAYYFMTYTVFFALPATSHLGMIIGLVVLVVGGLGMSAPVPGGVGTFHLLVAGALVIYGVEKTDGGSYAILLHSSQTFTVILLGGISFILAFLIGNKNTAEEQPEILQK